MSEKNQNKNLKGTWNQAILTFLLPIVLVLGVRWALIEPFVIPSGSMIPNLLVYDHILVKKFSYGLHLPFSNKWLLRWQKPERGDIIVFRFPDNPEIYYIKRLIGLPGDKVTVREGQVVVNDQAWPLEPDPDFKNVDDGFAYFLEAIPERGQAHRVRFIKERAFGENTEKSYEVPEEQYLFMGDNRDQSSDGRVWGFVKEDYLIGKSWVIWLSCESTLPTMSYVCDPSQIRWARLFKVLH